MEGPGGSIPPELGVPLRYLRRPGPFPRFEIPFLPPNLMVRPPPKLDFSPPLRAVRGTLDSFLFRLDISSSPRGTHILWSPCTFYTPMKRSSREDRAALPLLIRLEPSTDRPLTIPIPRGGLKCSRDYLCKLCPLTRSPSGPKYRSRIFPPLL